MVWHKVKTVKNVIDATHQLQRGGVQNVDARYSSETRMQQPTEPPPFHPQQQASQQYGHNADYYNGHSNAPFHNTTAQTPQQGSPSTQPHKWVPPQPGYVQPQTDLLGQQGYAPAPNYEHTSSPYPYQAQESQPRTVNMSGPWMNQWPNSNNLSSGPTYGYPKTFTECNSSPPAPSYNGPSAAFPTDYTPQSSATEHNQVYRPYSSGWEGRDS
jgi:hypothetical protein